MNNLQGAWNALREAISVWQAVVKRAVDEQYSRSLHLVVRDSTGARGFALFGGHRHRHHLSRIYLGEDEEHRARLGWHRSAPETTAARLVQRFGLAAFTGDTLPRGLADRALCLPFMVDFELPIPDMLEGSGAGWTGSAKADIAAVRRAGFRYSIERGADWIPAFCRDLYRPSIRSRHGAEALMVSARELRRIVESEDAEFIRVSRNDVDVAGILNTISPNGYYMRYLGWRRGDAELLRRHVVASLYWFSIRRAFELGHRRCFLGGSWPYLEDGLFYYKAKWGGRLVAGSTGRPDIHLLIEPAHETCRRFLGKFSLVTRGADGSFTIYSARTPTEARVPPSVLASVSRWYRWRRPDEGPDDVIHAIDYLDTPAHLRRWLLAEPL